MAAEAPDNPFEQFVNERLDLAPLDRASRAFKDDNERAAWLWAALHPPWRGMGAMSVGLPPATQPVEGITGGQGERYARKFGSGLPPHLRPRASRVQHVLLVGTALYLIGLVFWMSQQF